MAHWPVNDSKETMRRGKRAAGDRERIALQVGDNARWVRLRVDYYLMYYYFFAALQAFCFFSGVTGSFLCLLFGVFLFPLFSNCSFGSFVATLIGPGEFRRYINFFVLTSMRRRTERYRLESAR